MPDKYSLAKCEQYGRRLAARLCQQHFGPQPTATLDGPALLKLTPLRQLNLLVLHQLLGRWQHEATQLRSPYFDFEAAPVRETLGQFMNVLSRHISVGQRALEPLLTQAIAYTLLLATDAGAAFAHLLLPPASPAEPDAAVPLPYLRERLRYLELGKGFFEGFVNSLPTGNAPLSRAFLVQRLDLYRATHYKELPPLAPLVAELSALLPLTEADLWDDGPSKMALAKPAPTPPPPAAAPTAPEAKPAPAAPATSVAPAPAAVALAFTDAPFSAPAPAVVAAPVPQVAEPATAAPAPPPAATPAPAPVPVATPAAPSPPAEAKPAAPPVGVPSFAPMAEPAGGVPLYEKLKATQPTGAHLADTLRGTTTGTAPSLAERGAPKVGSLREAISINQRYSFINELFNGENAEYHAAIEHLDQLPTVEAALTYVQQELAPRHDWARREEHVTRLRKLIERKFGQGS
ncbi:MAG: hypothetical protein ACRYFK_15370 [Janthinobacterium lividum]